MSAKILIVDDEASIRDYLRNVLKMASYSVEEVSSGHSLESRLKGEPVDIVVLDLGLPDADGLNLIPEIKNRWTSSEIIVLTGNSSTDKVVSAVKKGAFHFLEKNTLAKSQDHLLLHIERALERKVQIEESANLKKAISTLKGGESPVFQSPSMKAALKTIERVAPTDVSVFIIGESGTGKEVIADLIHNTSNRNKGPLVKINCAALPVNLIESELFGSVKGAFTDAIDREGLFTQAEGGTLFLDELSEMPVETQSKLLRVLQEREARRVGGRKSYKINCRIIAATNRKVEDAIREGKLREDLYYRIGTIEINIPPLRERVTDIIPLGEMFLKRYVAQAGRQVLGFSKEAQEKLKGYDWPGNVRQLQNEIQRAALMCEGELIDASDLTIKSAQSSEAPESALTLMEAMEYNTIKAVLKETGGNKLETARRLGIGRQTLYNKIKAYNIPL